MEKTISTQTITRVRNRRQAYVLMLSGVICIALALLLHPDQNTYPVGVLILGIGMLIAAALNPYRLVIAGSLTTALGVAVYLVFRGLASAIAAYILAIGVGLLMIALIARRGYIGKGALTPAIMVIGVGIIEYLLAKNLTPSSFIPFVLSLWLPGIGLLVIGAVYWLVSIRG